MTRFAHAPILQHPERIHPLLWRGSQLTHTGRKTVATGYSELDAQLPGRGWPTGVLIEIMQTRSGTGEIQLLKPALLGLPDDRSIIFLNPPHIPSAVCLSQWFADSRRIFWIRTDSARNTQWVAEKILQHNTCAALLCWFDQAHPASVHRLHLAARQSSTLCFGLRPAACAAQHSVAPLRLLLEPGFEGLNIWLLNRRGPRLDKPVHLDLHQFRTDSISAPALHHDAMDQHLSDRTGPVPGHVPASHRHRIAAIHS